MLLPLVAAAQGIFYLATGIWSLVSRRSFENVTGSKSDYWLVQTVGVLVSVIGASLISAGARRQVTPETAALAVGAAGGLAGIDLLYVSRKRIRPIYLLDAAAEAGLMGGWAVGFLIDRYSSREGEHNGTIRLLH
jgi:hypothetical protein